MADYKPVMEAIEAELIRQGGKATTAELHAACPIGTPMSLVHNCIGYLAHVKVRPEGAGHFDPAIVYHHAMDPYIADGVEPEVDDWVRTMFQSASATTIPTATLNRVGKLSGHSVQSLKQAFTRLGCKSVRVSGTWHRAAPGTEAEPTETATLTPEQAVAAVRAEMASDEAPVVTYKRGEATEWIDSHRLQCRWICEFLSSDARDADEQGRPRDYPGCSPTMAELLESARYAKRPPTDDIQRAVAELVKVGRLAISDNQRIHATDAGMAWVGK